MKTLIDLLTIPRFTNLTLLTNSADATNEIESVEITETPDIAHYIPEKTFILTTAMSYKDNQQELLTLIDSLKEKQAAGLGIKVGRFIEAIDSDVVTYANQKKLPIVQIPSTIPLGSLLHQLLNLLRYTKTEQLSYALDIQKEFSDMLVNDVSYERFIDSFGELVNAPVILLDPCKKIMAYSKHFSKITASANYYVSQLLQRSFSWFQKKEHSLLIKDSDNKKLQVAYYPVESNSYFPHYLMILNPEQIPYPVSDFAIDQAKLVLSFMLYKNQKIQESLDHLKTDFLTRMIEYQQSSSPKERDWLDLGINYGLVKARHYRIIYIAIHNYESKKIRYQEEESQIAFQWLQESLTPQIKDMSLFKIKNTNHFALLIQHKLDNVEDILLKNMNELKATIGIQLVFGIGNVYDNIQQVAKSFIEAEHAYNGLLTTSLTLEKPIAYYQPRGMRNLFEKMNMTDIHYFCESTLKELAYPSEDAFIELRKTLKYYLDCQCEITQTAKALFVHRNTIKYRIERCSQLLGKDIHDSVTSLDIRLALELSEETLEQ
ncbi:PucR family transcriptional regulator [Candidatus Enterococcus willemsii]|uniref:Transcriptional regulator n=1 Tax=Candidatus Enterococcus willemsii TaxID=1857215 RepID=A0ABQ6YXD6_9ENTE|nr:PucR family transcriptional regulator [Enterococcus sp. CU12B]KAF1302547.1 transcriptional regulator [Enterococcus sp. CU12B]